MKYTKHIPILLLIFILGITGLKTYSTYGTQWDEYLQREMGRYTYNYVAEGNDSLKIWRGRDYGIVVELPLYVLEKKLAPSKPAASIFIRHLACFTLFCFGVFIFYLALLKLRFSSIWAFCGALMLVLSPRIYGHAFINSKDVPLMVFYILAFYTLLCFIEKPDIKRSFFHALATALLIDTRISGIIIIPLTVLFFMLFEFQKSDKSIKAFLGFYLINKLRFYLLLSASMVYVFWPYLWVNPIKNFLVAFLNMSFFRWKGYSLLFGEFIYSYETPWYFCLTWIAITTPLLYIMLFLVGFAGINYQLMKLKKLVFKQKEMIEKLIVLCFLFFPLLAVILLKSVLYDTWRHVYFVYPFLLIVALYGAKFVYDKMHVVQLKLTAILIFFSLISAELVKMVNAFPHEYVYFNELVSNSKNNIRYNYDMDYWGLSFKQGLEKILETDQRDTIKVTGNCYPAYSNYVLLKHSNPNCRLQYVLDEKDANYYLTTYRYRPKDHDEMHEKKIYSISYRNSEILSVFKLR